jgi:hypothetical protein
MCRLVSSSAWAYLWIRADGKLGFRTFLPPKLNLSQLKVLRSLEVGDWGTDFRPARHHTVMGIFATITSPAFSELVIIIEAVGVARLPSEVKLFETLRTMNGVRPFKLVFMLVVPDSSREETRRELAGALDSVTARGLLDFLGSPATFRSSRIRTRD